MSAWIRSRPQVGEHGQAVQQGIGALPGVDFGRPFFNTHGGTNGTTPRVLENGGFCNPLKGWRVGQDSNLQPSDPKS